MILQDLPEVESVTGVALRNLYTTWIAEHRNYVNSLLVLCMS